MTTSIHSRKTRTKRVTTETAKEEFYCNEVVDASRRFRSVNFKDGSVCRVSAFSSETKVPFHPSRHSLVGRASAWSQRHYEEQLSSHAGYQEVSRFHTRDKSQRMCNMYASAKCEQGCPVELWNPRTCNQIPKHAYQWHHKKDLCPPLLFFKERPRFDCTSTSVIPTNVCFIRRNDLVAWLQLHTGSRFQQVRLIRTADYNEKIFSQKKNSSAHYLWTQYHRNRNRNWCRNQSRAVETHHLRRG